MIATKSKARRAKEAKRKTEPRRRHKYCPVCKAVVPMSLIRKAEDDDDLYWLHCTECDNSFALTRQQYHRKKRPRISAIKKDRARIYRIKQTYSVGDVIYHRKLNDVGMVIDKAAAPLNSCSGAIVVSFEGSGQKMLIEGYTAA
jgi:transcription elongation factor Elf1